MLFVVWPYNGNITPCSETAAHRAKFRSRWPGTSTVALWPMTFRPYLLLWPGWSQPHPGICNYEEGHLILVPLCKKINFVNYMYFQHRCHCPSLHTTIQSFSVYCKSTVTVWAYIFYLKILLLKLFHSVTIPTQWPTVQLFHAHLSSFRRSVSSWDAYSVDEFKDIIVFCAGTLYLPQSNGIICYDHGVTSCRCVKICPYAFTVK